MPALRPLAVLLLLALLPAPADAAPREVRVKNRADLQRALERARTGLRILVEPGVYAGGLRAVGLMGTRKRPLLIAAADPKRPPIIRGGTSGLHLSDPFHVELRDLVLEGATGNGLNIDDGGSVETPAIKVTLTRLVVRNVGPTGNRDGIKLSGVDHVVIRDCRIEHWGSGGSAIDMVGCHDVRVHGCRIGPARSDGGSGIQAKGGSRKVLIQRCVFADVRGRAVNAGGSTGRAYFRPPDAPYEAQAISVEDCTFAGTGTAVAFVGCDGAAFRNNLVYRPERWVLRILQESRGKRFVPCRNGVFERNLVVFRSDELRRVVNIGPGTNPQSFRFAGNAWYCEDAPKDTKARVELPTREKDGVYGEDPRMRNPLTRDFVYLREGPFRDVGPRMP